MNRQPTTTRTRVADALESSPHALELFRRHGFDSCRGAATGRSAERRGAGRHGLFSGSARIGAGILLPVMDFMGARTLPGFSARTLRHPRLLRAIMAALFVGAALRVNGELLGGYAPGWSLAVAVGGVLGTLGFATIALGVWTTPEGGAKARSLA